MKRNLLALCLACAATGALAQGTVQFRGWWTSTTPAVDARVFASAIWPWGSGALLDGSNTAWRCALIGGPTTATPTHLFNVGTLQMMFYSGDTTVTWVNFNSGAAAPRFSGTPATGSRTSYVVPGVDWGGTALVQMVAWEGNYTTWADAWTASWTPGSTVRIGYSNPLTLTLPSSATSTSLTYLWGLNSFSIGPIPEPGACVLAGFGAATLIIWRRRS